MLVRVSCSRCRLSPAWTDDPDGLLQSVCNRPFRCLAQLCDEQLRDVTPRFMEERHLGSIGAVHAEQEVVEVQRIRAATAQRRLSLFSSLRRPRTLGVLAVSCLGASLISHDLASAYERDAILSIALELVLPALASLLVFRSSSKSAVAVALSVSISALAIWIFGIDRVSATVCAGRRRSTARRSRWRSSRPVRARTATLVTGEWCVRLKDRLGF